MSSLLRHKFIESWCLLIQILFNIKLQVKVQVLSASNRMKYVLRKLAVKAIMLTYYEYFSYYIIWHILVVI